MLSFIFRFWLVSGTFLWMPLFLYAQQVQKQPFTLTNKWDQKKYEGRIEVRTGMIAGKDQYSNGFWTLDFSQASTEKAGIRVTFRVKWLTEEDDFTDALYLDIKKVTPGAFLTQNTLSAQAVELTPVGDGKSMATFSLEFNASGEKYQGQIERGSKEVQYHYEIRGIDLLVVDACDDLEGSCFLDLSCLRNYLRDCPNGKHAERVKKQLVEMEAWEEATRQNRLEAFQTYIQKFPEGSFAEEAQARISGFEQEELLWNKAKTSNLLIDFEGYLSQYPQGKYANECRLAIQRLKPAPAPIPKTNKESGPPPDQQAWAALKQSFDLEQLTGFVKQFPNSDYRKYAEDRIKRITKKIAYFAEKKGPDNFFITLKNVFSPEIDSIVGQEGVQVNVTQLQNKYVFEMTYLDKEEHPVYIVDRMKNPGVASLMIPHLSELLQGKLALTEDSLFFTFKNGMPPYQLDV